jgi:hypothetical protein
MVNSDSEMSVCMIKDGSVYNKDRVLGSVVAKTQKDFWKGCASETSVIHSHFMLTFA